MQMFVTTLPLHRKCPKTGAWLFDPNPQELVLDQIKRMSTAMLKITESLSKGELVPADAIAVITELGS